MLAALNIKANFQAFREIAELMTRYRTLTLALAKREISERYAGQFFGTLWAFGHPLALILVYIFVFGSVFKIRVGGTVDMPFDLTTYMLAGIVPWLSFQESMSKASTVIIANSNIVKQVIFPIEVLPVKGALASLTTEIIFLVFTMIYMLIAYHTLPLTFALVPVLILIQLMGMIGVSYFLSATGVFFRDIKDVVQVFCTIAFYLMPILYLPTSFPESMNWILYANPFSHMVWCFQDLIYFGRFAHPWSWLVFGLLCLLSFIIGYRFFRKFKIMFGSMI